MIEKIESRRANCIKEALVLYDAERKEEFNAQLKRFNDEFQRDLDARKTLLDYQNQLAREESMKREIRKLRETIEKK